MNRNSVIMQISRVLQMITILVVLAVLGSLFLGLTVGHLK